MRWLRGRLYGREDRLVRWQLLLLAATAHTLTTWSLPGRVHW